MSLRSLWMSKPSRTSHVKGTAQNKIMFKKLIDSQFLVSRTVPKNWFSGSLKNV